MNEVLQITDKTVIPEEVISLLEAKEIREDGEFRISAKT